MGGGEAVRMILLETRRGKKRQRRMRHAKRESEKMRDMIKQSTNTKRSMTKKANLTLKQLK